MKTLHEFTCGLIVKVDTNNQMAFSFAIQHGGDHFNEDKTELQFLRSKPTCFIILGKPVIFSFVAVHILYQMYIQAVLSAAAFFSAYS